jgi:hypothetical protein
VEGLRASVIYGNVNAVPAGIIEYVNLTASERL